MSTISKALDWDLDQIKELNPIYKTGFIPASIRQRCVTGPLDKITLLVAKEDSIYRIEHPLPKPAAVKDTLSKSNNPFSTSSDQHTVKLGESLPSIAAQYAVTTEELMVWNALQSSEVSVGQTLIIKQAQPIKPAPPAPKPAPPAPKPVPPAPKPVPPAPKPVPPAPKPKPATPAPKPAPKPVQQVKKYYTVKSGDSLNKIASKNGLTISELKKLNPGLKSVIHPGESIRIK